MVKVEPSPSPDVALKTEIDVAFRKEGGSSSDECGAVAFRRGGKNDFKVELTKNEEPQKRHRQQLVLEDMCVSKSVHTGTVQTSPKRKHKQLTIEDSNGQLFRQSPKRTREENA